MNIEKAKKIIYDNCYRVEGSFTDSLYNENMFSEEKFWNYHDSIVALAGLKKEEKDLEAHIKDADLVVTGEGRLDGQSYMGKAPIGVAKLAKKYNKPVIAFSGCVTDDAVVCNEHGIDAFFPIVRKPTTLEEAMNVDNAYKNLTDTACQVFRLINTKI